MALSRRSFLGALSALGVTGASASLSACSGGSSGGGGAGGGGSLRLHERAIDYKLDYWKKLGQRFSESHGGLKFDVQSDDVGTNYVQKILTQITSNTIGDLFWMVNVENSNQFISKGIVEPLDDYISKGQHADIDQYLPGSLESFQDAEGKKYIIPTGSHAGPWALYYLMEPLEKRGVKPSTDWTYDGDFVDVLKELRDTSGDKYGAVFWFNNAESLVVMARSFGGDILNAEGTESMLLSDGTREAFAYLDDILNKQKLMLPPSQVPKDASGAANVPPLMQSGKVAMQATGPWGAQGLLGTLGEGAKGKIPWGVSLIPKGPAGRAGQLVIEGYGIPKRAKNKDLAYEFIEMMCSKEEGVARVPIGFLTAPRKDALNDPATVDDPYYGGYVKEMIANPPAVAHMPKNNRVAQWFDLLNKGFDNLWLGRESPDDALKRVDEQLKALLAQDEA